MKPAVVLPTYNEAENIREDHGEHPARRAGDIRRDRGRRIARRDRPDRRRARPRLGPRPRVPSARRSAAAATPAPRDSATAWRRDSTRSSKWTPTSRTIPFYLPEFLAESREWDVVIGSRSVPGGGARARGLGRRLVTAGAAFYLRTLLGLKGVRDPTSGYRCFRRSVLESIRLETLTSPGPGIVTEILYRCRGFRIKEIPILFQDREKGRSKFGLRAMWESLALAARLRMRGR